MDHLQYLVYTYLRAYIHMYRVSTKCCCLSLPALAPRACLFFQWGKPEHVLGWLSGIIICWMNLSAFTVSRFFMLHHHFLSLTLICLSYRCHHPLSFLTSSALFVFSYTGWCQWMIDGQRLRIHINMGKASIRQVTWPKQAAISHSIVADQVSVALIGISYNHTSSSLESESSSLYFGACALLLRRMERKTSLAFFQSICF